MPDTASFLNERGAWLRNEGTNPRNRPGFQRSQLTELANNDFESWAKESYEIATKISYRNGRPIGTPRGGAMNCMMVAAATVLPAGYLVSPSRIADRRTILAGYRLAGLTRLWSVRSQKAARRLFPNPTCTGDFLNYPENICVN